MPIDQADNEQRKGIDDPRAVEILAAEHWSLLSARTLGYQEMLGRATIFIAILSANVVALALLAQATTSGHETLLFALLLLSVALFIGIATFVRSVAINYEDARWVEGMRLIRQGYFRIVPEVEPFFITDREPDADPRALAHGSRQHVRNLANSLTTTSGVVATLNSVLVGALVADVGALAHGGAVADAIAGAALSLVSGWTHVRYAASYRAHRSLQSK